MLLLIVYFTSLILLITTVLTSVLQGFQLFTSVMIFANIGVFLRLAGGVIGASAGVSPAIIAGLITTGVSCVLFLIPLRFVFRVKSKPSGVSLGHALGYAVPTLIAILGITSLYSTDILLAKHYLPELDAGYYAALSVMGKIVFFASSSIAFVLLPVVAERAKQGVSSHRLTYGALAAIAVVSGIITAGYFLLPTVALRLLFGQSYYPAAPYLGMFGLFMTFYSLANGLLTTLLGEGRTRAWIIVACGALLEIAGIALYHSSLTAIILTDTLSAFAMFIALLLYYRHAGKKH
jgi:O-antigen/teichoic acid export membrane protein